MNEQKTLKPTPGVSVAQLLRDIQGGTVAGFLKEDVKTSYLRSKASSLKHEFPDRIYSVNELEAKTEVSWKPRSTQD